MELFLTLLRHDLSHPPASLACWPIVPDALHLTKIPGNQTHSPPESGIFGYKSFFQTDATRIVVQREHMEITLSKRALQEAMLGATG